MAATGASPNFYAGLAATPGVIIPRATESSTWPVRCATRWRRAPITLLRFVTEMPAEEVAAFVTRWLASVPA